MPNRDGRRGATLGVAGSTCVAFFLACGGQVQDSGPDGGFGGEDSGSGGDVGTGGRGDTDGIGGGSGGSGGGFGTGSTFGDGGASGGAVSGSGGGGATFGICPSGQWDSEAPLSDGRGCIPWSYDECVPGQELVQDGTALYDHLCADCAPGTFTTEVNQYSCEVHTVCSLAEEEAAPGSSSTDTECVPTEPLGFVDQGNFSWATALVATADGLWTAGQNEDMGLLLYAISFDGEREILLTSPAGAYVVPGSLVLLTDDSLVLAGSENADVNGSAETTEVFVRRMTLAGEEIWNRTFSSPDAGYESDVAASAGPNETIYVAGTTYGNLVGPLSGSSDVFVRKYESNGDVAWTEQLDFDPSYDALYGMAAGPNGNVYVTSTHNYSTFGSVLTALDSSGDVLWELESEDIGCGTCTELSVGPDGDLYVAGIAESYDENEIVREVVLTRISPTGTVQWVSRAPDATVQVISALAISGQTVHVLGGVGFTSGYYDVEDALRIDFDTSGEELQRSVWGGSAGEWVNAAAVTPDGDLYIAGGIERWRTSDYGGDAFVAKWPDP